MSDFDAYRRTIATEDYDPNDDIWNGHDLLDAYTAGAAAQIEKDAALADNWYMPLVNGDLCKKAGKSLAAAIRAQLTQQET